MNDVRFNYLLEKFINGTITPTEEEELKSLLLTGRYQDHFREDLTRYMEENFRSSEHRPVPLDADQLFEIILEKREAEEPAESTRFTLGYWLRIAAMLVLGLGIGWWLLFAPPETGPVAQHQETIAGEDIIRFTKKDFIHLPDGSTVLLNEDSELTYRISFGETTREVSLKGEAFFDITPDSNRPFIVRTGTISTNVLGTAFNVNARDMNVVVTVERGLVQVTDETSTLSLVRPDEQLTVDAQNSSFEKTGIKVAEEIKWKSESLVFDNIPLRQTVDMLQEHFGVGITIDNPAIEDCRISAWFLNNESLEEILEMVCGIRQARYAKGDSLITISGGIACDI